MQAQASSSSAVPQLNILTKRQVLWNSFVQAVKDLEQTPLSVENLRPFARAVAAYRALRADFVKVRRRKRWAKKGIHDPSLQLWTEQRGEWFRLFRRDDNVGRWLRRYQDLWGKWWRITRQGRDSIRRSKAKSNAKQAQRPEVKAAKAAYLRTEAGKASRRRSRKLSQVRARVAKGEAEQALYDSWAAEADLEAAAEALADVC
jgi:hypothetical protein